MARPNLPFGMRARTLLGFGLVIAFLAALTLASSPQLHEKLHPKTAPHECAATMMAAGNCEHTAPPAVAPAPAPIPSSPVLPPRDFYLAASSARSSILEHAPPIS
jgi:hypothetical protein